MMLDRNKKMVSSYLAKSPESASLAPRELSRPQSTTSEKCTRATGTQLAQDIVDLRSGQSGGADISNRTPLLSAPPGGAPRWTDVASRTGEPNTTSLTVPLRRSAAAPARWGLLYALGGSSTGLGIGSAAIGLALATGAGMLVIGGAAGVGLVLTAVGGALCYLRGRDHDLADLECREVKNIEDSWCWDSQIIATHLRQLDMADTNEAIATPKGRAAMSSLRSRAVDRITTLIASSIEITSRNTGDASELAGKAACLMTCRVGQATPSYSYQVESFIECLAPNAEISAYLRGRVAAQRRAQSCALGPYDLRLCQLEAMLEGADVSSFDASVFAAQVGIKLTETLLVSALVLASDCLGRRLVARRPKNESGTGAGSAAMAETRSLAQTIHGALLGDQSRATARMNNILRQTQRIYASEVGLLPSAFRNRISRIDAQLQRAAENADPDLFKTLLCLRQGPVLSCPTYVKKLFIGDNSDETHRAECQRIDVDVARLLADYPQMPSLEGFINQIRVNSVSTTPYERVQTYFFGSPGVGKTHFAEELAKVLQLPLVKLEMGDKDTVAALRGSPMMQAPHMLSAPDVSPATMLGLLPYHLLRAGVKNPIIFFDEAGELLSELPRRGGQYGPDPAAFDRAGAVSALKNLFDQKTRKLTLGALSELEIDFVHPIIIFAGNVAITETAIASRVPTHIFPDLDAAQRRKIVLEQVPAIARSNDQLPREKQAWVERRASELLPTLFDTCEAQRPQPGAKKGLHIARMVVSACVTSVYTNKEIDTQRLAEDVKEYYGVDMEDAGGK